MPLTATKISYLKAPKGRSIRYLDASGPYLFVKSSGSKIWHFRYRFEGKYSMISLGAWPEVSLKDARARRAEAKIQLSKGLNPSFIKKSKRDAIRESEKNNFEAIAREWHSVNSKKWDLCYGKRVLDRLENHVFPYLRKKPINKITPSEILEILRRIEKK
jgi:hypothetical protein